MVNARVRISVLVPILLVLIGAEVALGLVGMGTLGSERHASAAFHSAVRTRTTTPAKFAQITRTEAARRQSARHPSAPATRNVPTLGRTPTTVSIGWGCGDALAWLSSHAAPGYQFECPGYAEGHQAMTCINSVACPGSRVIVIADPCPAAYMNEAHNSWVVSGLMTGLIDPYGACI